MTTFWFVAGILVAVTLFILVPPLLKRNNQAKPNTASDVNLSVYRDQLRELDADLAAGTLDEMQYHNAKSDLERRVLEESGNSEATISPVSANRWRQISIAVLVLFVPALTIALYFMLGTPGSLEPQAPTAAFDEAHPPTPEQFEAMVKQLAERLEADPDNAEGWIMLARSYALLNRYQDASTAYSRAAALEPNNATVLADQADMLAMVKQTLQGEPEKITLQALKVDPDNLKALSLAGAAAFERRDYQNAIQWWQKLLKLVPADSPDAKSVSASINEARGLLGLPQTTSAPTNDRPAPDKQIKNGTVSGTVRLDPALQAKVAATDTVYIFARSADGGRKPPLAILRKQVKDLPLAFTLDDSMSMVPGLNLSSATSFIVGARISKTGSATASPNDLEGISKPVQPGQKAVDILINSEIK